MREESFMRSFSIAIVMTLLVCFANAIEAEGIASFMLSCTGTLSDLCSTKSIT
jgi:hypothetical protein